MADDEKTVAQPEQMVRGGELTDKVSRYARNMADTFVSNTRQDPNHPVWGNDTYGKKFFAEFGDTHKDLSKAIVQLADAISSAAAMTYGSGTAFKKAQGDAVGMIQPGQESH
ncbi:hypothetical protein ABZV75_39210 [Streptomyces flaveolus]|uniref:hypothetical protein n=1 Tax=Streptomyces flaveolus TaxID=67297 RepID=UPI0033B5DE30